MVCVLTGWKIGTDKTHMVLVIYGFSANPYQNSTLFSTEIGKKT